MEFFIVLNLSSLLLLQLPLTPLRMREPSRGTTRTLWFWHSFFRHKTLQIGMYGFIVFATTYQVGLCLQVLRLSSNTVCEAICVA
jgi:hypothetical protein